MSSLTGEYLIITPDYDDPAEFIPTAEGSGEAGNQSVTLTDPKRSILIIPDDDQDPAPSTFFWWKITGVSIQDINERDVFKKDKDGNNMKDEDGNDIPGAVIAAGDGAWGKTFIADDDHPLPVPNQNADLPWDLDVNKISLGRPFDLLISGFPIVFHLRNIGHKAGAQTLQEDWCLAHRTPKAHPQWCGDDIWPTDHRSPRQWQQTGVEWRPSTAAAGHLVADVFEGHNIVLDLQDEFGQKTVCVNEPPDGEAGYGRRAPGRRYLSDRKAPAADELGEHECGAMYYKRGYYVLKITVGWKQWACRGPDPDPDVDGDAPARSSLVCSEPIDRFDTVEIPVTVNNIRQRSVNIERTGPQEVFNF